MNADPILLTLIAAALGTVGLIAWAEKENDERREAQKDARSREGRTRL